jgi:hypothetical protein
VRVRKATQPREDQVSEFSARGCEAFEARTFMRVFRDHMGRVECRECSITEALDDDGANLRQTSPRFERIRAWKTDVSSHENLRVSTLFRGGEHSR